jgi:hypothetical protein
MSARHPSPLEPWEVDADAYPADGPLQERLRFALRYAILAPSTQNTQPWRFKVRAPHVELRPDRSRALPVADPDGRELAISCGAALRQLEIALSGFGQKTRVTLLPDPADRDLLAVLEATDLREPTYSQKRLLAAIPRRRTNRLGFEDRPFPMPLVDELRTAAADAGAWLRFVEDPQARTELAELAAEAQRSQFADARYRHEHAAWVQDNRAERADGVPGYAHGIGDLPSRIGAQVVRTLGPPNADEIEHRAMLEAPMLALIGTHVDDLEHWIVAGRALAGVLLRAQVDGVQAAYANAIVEVPELRRQLGAIIEHEGAVHLVLRLGRGRSAKPTPRHAVEAVAR